MDNPQSQWPDPNQPVSPGPEPEPGPAYSPYYRPDGAGEYYFPARRIRKLYFRFAVAELGGLLLASTALLPFVTVKVIVEGFSNGQLEPVSTLDASGSLKNGPIALLLGLLIMLLSFLGVLTGKKGLAFALLALGVLATLLMFFELGNTGDGSNPGLGFILGIMGGILTLAGSLLSLLVKPRG